MNEYGLKQRIITLYRRNNIFSIKHLIYILFHFTFVSLLVTMTYRARARAITIDSYNFKSDLQKESYACCGGVCAAGCWADA